MVANNIQLFQSITLIQLIGTGLFAIAVLHTFATGFFERLAHRQPAYARWWHLLAEIELVFGFWALILLLVMYATNGTQMAIDYLVARSFIEPLFIFAIMVIAASRPILQTVMLLVRLIAARIPLPGSTGLYLAVLILVPLLGSFITEPAAMTLAALILAHQFFSQDISMRLKYATLGVLFVNISIGGMLTPFAAPAVLIVAAAWHWDITAMMSLFGWKAAIAVVVNAVGVSLLFRKELARLSTSFELEKEGGLITPWWLVVLHLILLAGVVVFAHQPMIFMGLFALFLGLARAYPQYQDHLIVRQGLLVALFLAGLVVLGGQQEWWLRPFLMNMPSDHHVFFGTAILTAFADNAALTYLGSLVSGLSDNFKYALVAGAVTGGGLSIIANAPNPAGAAILRGYFEDGMIRPVRLLLAAFLPTVVAALAFRFL